MKNNILIGLGLSVLLAVGVACGGKSDEDEDMQSMGPAAAAKKAVDASTAGSVSGKIDFKGAAPKMNKIDMAADALCASLHSETVRDMSVVINANNTLKNVIVYVKKGYEGYTAPALTQSPMVDQHGCMYNPHILIMSPGTLQIRSSDNTLHNVHAEPKINQPFNRAQPAPGMIETKLMKTEIVPVKCDVHPWMRAYIGVFDVPATVTGDDGSFKLDMLPPGTYEIEAWHEKFGTQSMTVTVESGKSAPANFTFSAPGA